MSRLAEELKVAAKGGVIASATVATVGFAAFVRFTVGGLPKRVGLGLLMAVAIFVFGFLVSYVYGDAKRRGMRALVWALIALFVPNVLGFLAYFLLREPLLVPCSSCGAATKRDFGFCPECGSALPRTCPNCRRPVEPLWPHCAHCGHKLFGGSPSPSPGRAAG